MAKEIAFLSSDNDILLQAFTLLSELVESRRKVETDLIDDERSHSA